MSKIFKKARDKKNVEHQKYISRITKTLYYGKFPKPDELSLPVTELAAELFSEARRGRTIDRLHYDDAANISRNACVSPCSLVLAILYLEKLKKSCPEYLERTASSDLFLVSLMVSCKFLYDDGEEDEVFLDQWASSGNTTIKQLVQLEKDFLKAIKWEIFVNELTFWKKLEDLEKTLAKKQGIRRGFFTYTELLRLLDTLELHVLLQNVVAVSLILIASYTAALLALCGSVAIVSHVPGTYLQSRKIEVNQNTPIPIGYESVKNETIESNFLTEIDSVKYETKIKTESAPLSILKTSIFLASIETFLKPFCNKSDVNDLKETANIQNISWDWWNTPVLKWLSDSATSYLTEIEVPDLEFSQSKHYYDTFITSKYMDLEDQVHKPTKLRMQDQLESSWHAEWTDTIKHNIQNRYIHNNVLNVKS